MPRPRGWPTLNGLAQLVLDSRSERQPYPAIADPSGAMDNRTLVATASDVSNAILQADRGRRGVVVVELPLGMGSIVMLMAAILGDYSLCFLDPSADRDRARLIVESLRPTVLVGEDGVHETGVNVDEGSRIELPGYVAMSSGSVGGGPKGVLSSWESVAAFVPHGAEALCIDQDSSWGELSHPGFDMAMTNLLVALGCGAGIKMSSRLGDRMRPLRFADRAEVTHMRVAPRHVELASAERRTSTTRTLQVWASGGDRLFSSQVERVFAFGVPIVINTYGTSESIGFASAARFESQQQLSVLNESVTIGNGAVGPWRAIVHDAADDGLIEIQSPHMPKGYLFGQASDYPVWESAHTLITGDIGAMIGENLFCLGREGRRIKRNGSFVDLNDIDAKLFGKFGSAFYTVHTADGELLSLTEASTDLPVIIRELPSVLPRALVPDRVVLVGRLPRLGNGKIDQMAARRLAEDA